MTTSKETVLLMSRLTVDETPQHESNSPHLKNCCYETTEWETKLESLDDEMEVSSRTKMADQNIDMSDQFPGRLDEASRINKAREKTFDQQDDEIECSCLGSCRGTNMAARMTYDADKGDNVYILDNNDTVLVELGCQHFDHSTTDSLTETKTPHSPQSLPSNPFGLCSTKSSPAISRIKNYNNADNPIVNISVVDNKGTVIIGENVLKYVDDSRERSTAGQSNGRSELVITVNGVVMQSPQRGPVFSIDKNTMKWLQKFYQITNEIHPLRDNAKWDDFYKKVDTGLQAAKKNDFHEIEIFLTIEKSTALCYQGENSKSRKMVEQAKDMIFGRPRLNMREFLIIMTQCQLSALYRRENKFAEAVNALSIAEQNVEVVPSNFAKVYVNYEKASDYHAQHSNSSQSKQDRDHFAELAKNEFKKCISTCEIILLETNTIYLRKHHFCLVKLALLNLDCKTTAARNQSVSEKCVREAGDCISWMQQRYKGEMGESTAMLLRTAETDHFHRRGDYAKAEFAAQLALHKAKSLGFQSEVHELQGRLKHMQLLKQQMTPGSYLRSAIMPLSYFILFIFLFIYLFNYIINLFT